MKYLINFLFIFILLFPACKDRPDTFLQPEKSSTSLSSVYPVLGEGDPVEGILKVTYFDGVSSPTIKYKERVTWDGVSLLNKGVFYHFESKGDGLRAISLSFPNLLADLYNVESVKKTKEEGEPTLADKCKLLGQWSAAVDIYDCLCCLPDLSNFTCIEAQTSNPSCYEEVKAHFFYVYEDSVDPDNLLDLYSEEYEDKDQHIVTYETLYSCATGIEKFIVHAKVYLDETLKVFEGQGHYTSEWCDY